MRTIEKAVYQFDELSEDAKEKAIEKWYETEDYPFLSEDIEQELDQIDSYFEDIDLQYSLSWCQGDGLSFSGKFNLKKWLNDRTNYKESVKWALTEIIYNVYSKGNTNRYCYASKSDITFDENYGSGEYDLLFNLFESEVLPDIQSYYLDICKKLEKYGYSILEYRMDNAEFSEHCEANNYEFDEYGNLI